MQDLIIQESPGRGRGVFAARAFAAGETIEICPVIAMPPEEAALLDRTVLYNYYFGWPPNGEGAAIALGYGLLYNHSPTPNAKYEKSPEESLIRFTSLCPIAAGEEIFVFYTFPGAAPGKEVWFDVR